jgi:threonine/homoserine/homoserine lactone efflux protein
VPRREHGTVTLERVDPSFFLRGAVLGFTIAATVGPITMLTIRRTLAYGWAIGFASGLGVVTVDTTYGAVAAFGITAVSDVLVAVARPLALVGGLFLIYLGIRTMRSQPVDPREADPAGRPSVVSAYASIVGLTFTNPLTIISFAALFVSFGVHGSAADAMLVVVGVAIGSLLWWVILTTTLAVIRHRLSPRTLRAANVVSGAVITVFGMLALVKGVTG